MSKIENFIQDWKKKLTMIENPVYRKMFESYLRIVSIYYLDTFWMQCIVFLRKHIQIL